MEVNELMIGDWVQITHHHNPKPIVKVKQVDLIDFRNALKQIYPRISYDPIRITPEILEKSGFEPIRQDAVEPYYWQFFDIGEGHVINAFRRIYRGLWIECSNATTETRVNKQCEYVHELQHALRLAGIKKEIVL
jgi:hypothetical protein